MELPPNLEELALYKFDQLLLQGKLLYSYSEPERVGDHGFPVSSKQESLISTN